MSFTKAIEKQDTLLSTINGYFTRGLVSQSDNGDGTVTFETDSNHNFVVGDHVVLYVSIDSNNNITEYTGYDTGLMRYEVTAITDNTFTITITYDGDVDVSSAYVRSVFVYNNDQMNIGSAKKYPLLVVEARDTDSVGNNTNDFIPAETQFVLAFCDALSHHDKGDNKQIRSCRIFNEAKLEFILDNIKKKILSQNIRRGEFKWYTVDISFIDVEIED